MCEIRIGSSDFNGKNFFLMLLFYVACAELSCTLASQAAEVVLSPFDPKLLAK